MRALRPPARRSTHVRSMTLPLLLIRRLTMRSSEQRLAITSFPFFHLLRGQPLSLSLEASGPATLFAGFFEDRRVPVPFVAGGASVPTSSQHTPLLARAVPSECLFFLASPSLRSCLPGGLARHSPAGGSSVLPAFQRPSVGGRPNPRSSEQRLAKGLLCFFTLVPPASVAELESVRLRRHVP